MLHLDIVYIGAALLNGPSRVAILASQLNQEQNQLFMGAAQQIASGHFEVLNKDKNKIINLKQ